MQSRTSAYNTAVSSSVRQVKAKVELFEGSTAANTFTQDDSLISIEIQRNGENNKFFGFVVCQRINFHLRDKDREINISTANTVKASIGFLLPNGTVEYMSFPTFYVTEVNRDENTNELSVTGYDLISKAEQHTLSELTTFVAPYSTFEFIDTIAAALGTTKYLKNISTGDPSFNWSRRYTNGANYEVDEDGHLTDKTNFRQALKDIAESVQAIVFMDYQDRLCFRKFKPGDTSTNLTITKPLYFTLKSRPNKRLQTIVRATELGDNISVSTTNIGSTQVINNSPFMEDSTLIESIMNTALTYSGDLTIGQFELEWRGNPATEVGDFIKIEDKDRSYIYTYLLNDTITYNGSLNQKTSWDWDSNNESTEAQPVSTISDQLNKTYAKVDRVNKEITLVASDVKTVEVNVVSAQASADEAQSSADNAQSIADAAATAANEAASSAEEAKNGIADTNNTIQTIQTDISEIKQTAENITISVKKIVDDGVSKIETGMGYSFDDEGLNISRTDSELSTTINEDGMKVKKNDEEMLVANNQGVDAVNLHAKTYLIIGNNSRIEDYEKDGTQYTACFWIGG